jgi:hypothetical protein
VTFRQIFREGILSRNKRRHGARTDLRNQRRPVGRRCLSKLVEVCDMRYIAQRRCRGGGVIKMCQPAKFGTSPETPGGRLHVGSARVLEGAAKRLVIPGLKPSPATVRHTHGQRWV